MKKNRTVYQQLTADLQAAIDTGNGPAMDSVHTDIAEAYAAHEITADQEYELRQDYAAARIQLM